MRGVIRVALVQPEHIHVSDARRVLEQRPDVQVVGDPAAADAWLVYARTSKHLACVEDAARAGCAIFVEKPLAASAALARTLAQRLDSRSQIGLFLRYCPAIKELRRVLREATLGPIRMARVRFVHGGWAAGWFAGEHAWMADPREGGGGYFDLAVHCVDLLEWLAGPITDIESSRLTGEHHGTAHVSLERGAEGRFEAGWQAPELSIEVEVESDHSHALVRGGRLTINGISVLDSSPPSAADAVTAWLDHLTGRPHPPLVTAPEATRNVDLIETLRACTLPIPP